MKTRFGEMEYVEATAVLNGDPDNKRAKAILVRRLGDKKVAGVAFGAKIPKGEKEASAVLNKAETDDGTLSTALEGNEWMYKYCSSRGEQDLVFSNYVHEDIEPEIVGVELSKGAEIAETVSSSRCIYLRDVPYPDCALRYDVEARRIITKKYRDDDSPGRPTGNAFCIGVVVDGEFRGMSF